MKSSPDVIYFGGTFDPVHLGHVDAVKIAHEAFPDSKIVLVPSFSPAKSASELKSVTTDFIDRVAMCVVAFDEFPYVDVSSVEEELDSPSYTINTIRALKAENPGQRTAWMIGGDQLANFPKWKCPKEILEETALIIVPRQSEAIRDLSGSARNVVEALGFKIDESGSNLGVIKCDGGSQVIILSQMPRDVSSTDVRKMAAADINDAARLIPAPVVDYIVDLGLYQA